MCASILRHEKLKEAPIFPINADDEDYFYELLSHRHTRPITFEYNWPYIIQATRERGYTYKKDNSVVYFFFRNLEDPSLVVVVNFLGEYGRELAHELTLLLNELGLNVLHKNINKITIDRWLKLGYEETKEPWSPYSFRDDNSFPNYICDFERISNAHIPLEANTKRLPWIKPKDCRKIRKFLKERQIQVEHLKDRTKYREEIKELLNLNARDLARKGTDSFQNVIDAHIFMFSDKIHKNIIEFAYFENDHLLAHSFFTQVGDYLFANSLINEAESGLRIFLLWQAFNFIKRSDEIETPAFLSMQGSEVAGQDHWKKKMHPIASMYKTHIIKYGKK